MPGLELRHLSTFEAIVRAGSFRAAAADLGYAPSAVSQHISHLERLLGARLIARAPGTAPIALTDAGRSLVDHARSVVSRFASAEADLTALLEGRAGTLRVGAFESAAARVLPRVVPAFARSCPAVEVVIRESPTEAELFGRVEREEVDLAFCQLPLLDGPFECVALMEDPFTLVVPAGSPLLSRDEPPSLAEIARMPLVGFDRARASHGIGGEPVVRSDANAAVQGLVAAGAGIAIVPRLCVDPHHPGTRAIELLALPARTIALMWHSERHLGRPAELFIDAVRGAV